MELKWTIRTQTDVQTNLEELRERISLIGEEKCVIT